MATISFEQTTKPGMLGEAERQLQALQQERNRRYTALEPKYAELVRLQADRTNPESQVQALGLDKAIKAERAAIEQFEREQITRAERTLESLRDRRRVLATRLEALTASYGHFPEKVDSIRAHITALQALVRGEPNIPDSLISSLYGWAAGLQNAGTQLTAVLSEYHELTGEAWQPDK